MTNKEWCELFELEYHDVEVDHESGGPYCLTCDMRYSKCPQGSGRREVKQYNFLNPSDKELGVMLDWCLEKGLTIALVKIEDELYQDNSYHVSLICFEEQTQKKITNIAPTKTLALRGAIEEYVKRDNG